MTPVIYVGDEEVDEEVDMDLESEPEVQVGQWDGDHHDDDSVRGEWRRMTALFLNDLTTDFLLLPNLCFSRER